MIMGGIAMVSANPKTKMEIIVTGDVTMDWNLARIDRSRDKSYLWVPGDYTRACWMRGGASLLADLIDAIARDLSADTGVEYTLSQPASPGQPVDPANPMYHHSYAIWSPYNDGGDTVWRVKEYLGMDRGNANVSPEDLEWDHIVDEPDHVDLLIVDDSDLGFRNRPELWPKSLSEASENCWILLKMSAPVARGPLWEHMLKHFSERLVTVTTVGDLRRTAVQISKGLSWERTAQDIAWELVHNPRVNGMARCAHTIVSFGAAGAVVLSQIHPQDDLQQKNIKLKGRLLFDPQVIEDMWEADHPGGMIGYTTCLVGGVARQLLQKQPPDILPGIHSGLLALRDLHQAGYANIGSDERPHLTFPTERIVQALSSDSSPFAVVEIQDPVRFLTPGKESPPQGGFWTILEDRYQENLEQVGQQIVLHGAQNALQDVPQGIFAALFTVDRQEIESFRSIHTLVREYLDQDNPERPLSIAVFGAPGAGKSFGIKQVAKSLAPKRIEDIEFNLSQFTAADNLANALHQVRDINLSGKMPLVFWDEFDTPFEGKPLGWLRYFLAPMQDGAFREGEIEHPIGPAIFVFVGGTSERMGDFGGVLGTQEYRATKVTDFISRLKGFVNILGPNRQVAPDGDSSSDPYYLIRRAILIRSIMDKNAPHLFQEENGARKLRIDHGVLRAFLNTRVYKHGIRSMEAVVAMSQLAGITKYERSSLPAAAQLDLHVDGGEFLALVQQIDFTEELLEKLAANYHQVYCQRLIDEGYQWAEMTDSAAKTHSSLVPYEKLPEYEKEQNRDNVRHMADKLQTSGYIMIPARSNEPPFEFPEQHQVDELAKMEHERWISLKEANGWRFAPKTDKDQKMHQDMVPWEQLSEEGKDKDRLFVRAIPKILSAAGYTIVKLHPITTEN
jgi:hypothetical protein